MPFVIIRTMSYQIINLTLKCTKHLRETLFIAIMNFKSIEIYTVFLLDKT